MGEITKSMCWDLVVIGKDKLNGVAAAIYRKPTDNECYNKRPKNEPPICDESDDPNKAWYAINQKNWSRSTKSLRFISVYVNIYLKFKITSYFVKFSYAFFCLDIDNLKFCSSSLLVSGEYH